MQCSLKVLRRHIQLAVAGKKEGGDFLAQWLWPDLKNMVMKLKQHMIYFPPYAQFLFQMLYAQLMSWKNSEKKILTISILPQLWLEKNLVFGIKLERI